MIPDLVGDTAARSIQTGGSALISTAETGLSDTGVADPRETTHTLELVDTGGWPSGLDSGWWDSGAFSYSYGSGGCGEFAIGSNACGGTYGVYVDLRPDCAPPAQMPDTWVGTYTMVVYSDPLLSVTSFINPTIGGAFATHLSDADENGDGLLDRRYSFEMADTYALYNLHSPLDFRAERGSDLVGGTPAYTLVSPPTAC